MRQEADIPLVSDEPKTFANRNDRILVCLLCFAAAIHVFIFSSAFPFFSNVDEYLHFDLITQYSHGQFPRSFYPLKQETLDWIVTYASPEFLAMPEQFPNGQFPAPLWKRSGPEVEAEIAATKTVWSSEVNFESSQPPLYYALAMNVPLIAIVVWMGYRAARMIAPERVELRIGVPLLIAFIPQNVFYAMNNDVLSPVSFGALFLCSLQWLRAKNASLWLGAVTGFAVAAAYLTKLSNLPLIAVTLVAVIVKLLLIVRRTQRTGLVALGALIVCAAIPIGSWMVWTKYQFGDPTGSTAKITLLGWTTKPFDDWWRHPIFTLRGLWLFWSNLMASFWRGEVSWHGRVLSWGLGDRFFAISTLILLGSATVGLRRRAGLSTFQQQAIGIAILVFLAGVVFLALLSIQFDFGDSTGPSRGYPYFTAGRLLSGALIPFALAYVYGIAFLSRRTSAIVPLIAIGTLAGFLVTSEMVINHATFASEHNWFHR